MFQLLGKDYLVEGRLMMMVDWVTAFVPCLHPEPITGGCVLKVDFNGETEWETKTGLQVEGSYESTLRIRTEDVNLEGQGTLLCIHGNPSKWLQGHNLFGSDNLIGLVAETMERLVCMLGLTPIDLDRAAWWRGRYRLTRVDVTTSYQLPSRAEVRSWLRSAEYSAHMRHRGRGEITKNGTLYYGKQSRRWALKCYSKGDEIEAKGHELKSGVDLSALKKWADDKLRVEVVMRSLELKRRGLDKASKWGDNTCRGLHREVLEGLHMSDTHTLSQETLQELPARLQLAYQAWKRGEDLRIMLPRKTFYRYRTQLLSSGIDIAIKQPREDRSNVVPLIRVLEAKPASIPDWAYGTPLLFEPRSRAK